MSWWSVLPGHFPRWALAAADLHAALNNLFNSTNRDRRNWGLPIDRVVARYPDVFDRLAALRPRDGARWKMRMFIRTEERRFEDAIADSQQLEATGGLMACAIAALMRGDTEELERLRAQASTLSDRHSRIILLGLAPTNEPMTTHLMTTASELVSASPENRVLRFRLGVAQLRAGKFPESIATLEAAFSAADDWQGTGRTWPLLAMAHHHLGNSKRAREFLDKSALWFRLYSTAGDRFFATSGPSRVGLDDCLTTLLYYWEAQALIDGPAVAAESREQWLNQAEARRRDDETRRNEAVGRAEAARQQLAANAESDLAEATRRDPNDGAAWSELGRFCYKAGRLDESASHLAKALALRAQPENPWGKPETECRGRSVPSARYGRARRTGKCGPDV